ncbi:twin-arginine translocase TatA/TatE family subunit [Thermodesulfobacteriota bacterium]
MFGIGLPELILILAVALIVVGPDKLPDMAKSVAKQLIELKKVAGSFKDSLNDEFQKEQGGAPFDGLGSGDHEPLGSLPEPPRPQEESDQPENQDHAASTSQVQVEPEPEVEEKSSDTDHPQ